MTIAKIAAALCEPTYPACAQTIIPPWIDGADDIPARDAWRQVQMLRSQQAQLTELWPHKKEQLEGEFNAAVRTLAMEVYSKLFDLTP